MASAPDCLDSLPVEILLQILCHVTETGTLDSILRASPTAYRLFDSHAVEITEAVLTSGYTCGHILVTFRIAALLRSGSFPISSLSDFRRFLDDSTAHIYRKRGSKPRLASLQLGETTSPAVLRSVLATSRHINRIAHECLSTMLARFNAVDVEHLAEKGSSHDRQDPILSWIQARPETTRVHATCSEPPSWGEEQRAVRACWRLQLIYDLKKAAEKGRLPWVEDDLAKLRETAAIVVPLQDQPPENRYDDAATRGLYNFYQQVSATGTLSRTHPEYEELVTVVEYVRDSYGYDSAESMANGVLGCKDLNEGGEMRRKWPLPGPHKGREWRSIIWPSRGADWYNWSRTFRAKPDLVSWRRVVRFEPYARLGFAFWSTWRLARHGHCTIGPPVRAFPEIAAWPVRFAWYSILDSEELSRVRREIEE